MTSYAALDRHPDFFSDFWAEKPERYAAFIQDRLDIGDVVVQLGASVRPLQHASEPVAGFPRISTNPALDTMPAGTDPDVLYVPDQSFDYISPRVQVAFPVTERTNFRLSYAQAVQSPDFALVLSGINTDISVTNTNNVYGQNVDYGKSIIFEFGIQHAFNDDMVLDISAYNRDNLANAAGRLVNAFDPVTGADQHLRLVTNSDFGNTKGLDLRLNRRFGQLFNGTLGYSYTQAANTGSDPFTYINFGSRVVNTVTGGNQPPPQAIAPIALSRPHNLVGALALTFPNGWNAGSTIGSNPAELRASYMIFRFASGTAYTACAEARRQPVDAHGPVGCARGGFLGGLNSERLPDVQAVGHALREGLQPGWQPAVPVPRRPEHPELHEHADPVRHDEQHHERASSSSRTSPADSVRYASEATGNGVYSPTPVHGPHVRRGDASGCGGWVNGSAASRRCRTASTCPGRAALRQRRRHLHRGRAVERVQMPSTTRTRPHRPTSMGREPNCGSAWSSLSNIVHLRLGRTGRFGRARLRFYSERTAMKVLLRSRSLAAARTTGAGVGRHSFPDGVREARAGCRPRGFRLFARTLGASPSTGSYAGTSGRQGQHRRATRRTRRRSAAVSGPRAPATSSCSTPACRSPARSCNPGGAWDETSRAPSSSTPRADGARRRRRADLQLPEPGRCRRVARGRAGAGRAQRRPTTSTTPSLRGSSPPRRVTSGSSPGTGTPP